MKIDLHLHTKKTKSGDPESRNVTKEIFKNKLVESEISVVAITNHNEFDINQFIEFRDYCKGEILLWPGVELDVQNVVSEGEKINNGHVLVISDNDKIYEFKSKIDRLCNKKNPDDTAVTIEDLCSSFDGDRVIFIVHYKKNNELINKSIDILKEKMLDNQILLYEPSNLRSAKILVKENKNIIVGTDIRDWSKYKEVSNNRVPDTKFDVTDFSKFYNVLNRDVTTINSIFEGYDYTTLTDIQMPEGDAVSVRIYKDLNVVYGDKGTGKTVLLEGIAKTLRELGHSNTIVINPNQENIKITYNLKGLTPRNSFLNEDFDECEEEIQRIKQFSTKDVTPISNYLSYYKSKLIETNADKIKLNELRFVVFTNNDNTYQSMIRLVTLIRKFKNDVTEEQAFTEVFKLEDKIQFDNYIDWMMQKTLETSKGKFIDVKSRYLTNRLISIYQRVMGEISSNTEAPGTTSFYSYASNKLELLKDLEKIQKNLKLEHQQENLEIGELNKKGKIYYSEDIVFSEVNLNHYKSFRDLTKDNIFKIRTKLNEIKTSLFTESVFEHINELVSIDSESKFNKLEDLLIFRKRFVLSNGSNYLPSDGESAIIKLRNELKVDREYYVIDEPEKSMGNLIINNEIMPEINKLIKRGKHIVITTHDANLAVRTMPVQTIYRVHENGNYDTFSGNLFSNILVNNDGMKISWNETSLNIFEGGELAFKEREYIYDFERM